MIKFVYHLNCVLRHERLYYVEFDKMVAIGLGQAKDDDSFDVDEAFAELEQGEMHHEFRG